MTVSDESHGEALRERRVATHELWIAANALKEAHLALADTDNVAAADEAGRAYLSAVGVLRRLGSKV